MPDMDDDRHKNNYFRDDMLEKNTEKEGNNQNQCRFKSSSRIHSEATGQIVQQYTTIVLK
uniref:Uncharacterized protein n=1 Tax=Arion vulgaris TaxID=1028688 RepID=A0A0B7ARR0_9EUPU